MRNLWIAMAAASILATGCRNDRAVGAERENKSPPPPVEQPDPRSPEAPATDVSPSDRGDVNRPGSPNFGFQMGQGRGLESDGLGAPPVFPPEAISRDGGAGDAGTKPRLMPDERQTPGLGTDGMTPIGPERVNPDTNPGNSDTNRDGSDKSRDNPRPPSAPR
jgi:hypothetical protein